MSDFFIKRPIFAWVLAIVIMLAGLLSIVRLPVAQYPQIALPAVVITSTYPGASAETLENTVTQVIEQNMTGLDHLLYMASTSESSGQAKTTLTFNAGTNADIAQVQVQNKLQLATPQLPQEVQRMGLTVSKSRSSFLMIAGFYSEDGSMSDADIADYVASNLQDGMARIDGVGQVQLFGSPHSMRVWLDPDKLSSYGLTVADISNAIQTQNVQVSAGQLGGTPPLPGQRLNAVVSAQSHLETPEQFRSILLRVHEDGSRLTLGDVARIELGQQSYDFVSRYSGKPSSGISISLSSTANAIETARLVKEYIANAEPFFPPGLRTVYPYDTTPFISLSIREVVKTLLEAVALVFLVMFLFLQKIRVTIIPTIAVPVVLLGTFGVLSAAGYSINTLTMFGMVLAIGLLVDDAIVVVENVERVMSEDKLSPAEATSKSMHQITSALVGIAVVLSAVFVPMAFFGGSTGVIYRQFSITIVSAMILSVFVAVVLTPALCATILKEDSAEGGGKRGFFGWFNRSFSSGVGGYVRGVGGILRHRFLAFLPYIAAVVLMAFLFTRIPTAFLPDEDQGILMVEIQLPAGATRERTMAVVQQVERHFLEDEKRLVKSVFAVLGFSFSGSGQNSAMAFVSLKDWDERPNREDKVKAIAARAQHTFAGIKDGLVYAIVPPAVTDLGNANGYDIQLVNRGGLSHADLMAARNKYMMLAMSPEYAKIMTGVRPNGKDDTPQYRIHIDTLKASSQGVSIPDIHEALQTGWGGAYVNDFLDKGRIKKVYLQANSDFRRIPEDLDRWYIRNSSGKMVSLSTFTTRNWEYGSPRLERYNGLPSAEIIGQPAPGKSTGEAMAAAEKILKELPAGIGGSWTGISLQEQESGQQAPLLYALSLLVIFLCLAALYESWSIPFSVMLVVPLGIIGVQFAALLFGQANDIYFQVGFLTVAGLSAKNAILIVEFAKDLQGAGKSAVEAVLDACRMRVRPIIMTSMATILGVLPLAISNGAGSGSQNAVGIAVIGGMISNTILGIFFVPLFFVTVRRLFKK